MGEGLNRKAQITLDQVWPKDKTLHESITDPDRLNAMDFEGKLRRACDKADTRFLEYRPDTGSWVFKVDHFSKYGLADSDDEDEASPTDAKKAKGPNDPPLAPVAAKSSAAALPPQPTKTWPFETQDRPFVNALNLSQSNAILQRMEVDSHKLQAMKSSFFAAADEEYENQSVVSDTSESSSVADQIVPKWGDRKQKRFISPGMLSSISENERAEENDDELTSVESVKSVRAPPPVRPPVVSEKVRALHVKPKVFKDIDVNLTIPLAKSEVYSTKYQMNPIYFNGRRFKVGWGPDSGLQLLKPADDDDSQLRIASCRKSDDFSPSLVRRIRFPPNDRIVAFRQSIEPHLEIELKHDKISRDPELECPFFEANGGVRALPEHVTTAGRLSHLSALDDYASTVWDLCKSLWGEREELEGVDELSHNAIMFRRDMFSEWIEDVITDAEVLQIKAANEYLDQLLELLMAHKITDACEMAIAHSDYNLSLLLAQMSGGSTVKQLIQHQLALWQDVQADRFIDKRKLKAFMIIAGLPVFHANDGMLNIYDGKSSF